MLSHKSGKRRESDNTYSLIQSVDDLMRVMMSKRSESVKMSGSKVVTFLWVTIVAWIGLFSEEGSSTATFQVNVPALLGAQKMNSPLSSIIDFRQTNLETVKNVYFKYFDRLVGGGAIYCREIYSKSPYFLSKRNKNGSKVKC